MTRKLVAIAAVAASGLVSAGCAAADAATSIDPGTATATYSHLVDDIYGTSQQRLDDDRRNHTLTQQGLVDCMGKAGFDYTVAPFITVGGGPIDPGDITSIAPVGLPDLGVAKVKESVARATLTSTAMTRLGSATEQAAYDKAIGECASKASIGDRWYPDGARDLRAKLVEIFRSIENQQSIKDKLTEYRSCMGKTEFHASTYLSLRQTVEHNYPAQEMTWSSLSTTGAWSQAVSAEKAAAAADTACRTDLHDTVMALGASKVQALIDDNVEVLSTIELERAARDALPIPTNTKR